VLNADKCEGLPADMAPPPPPPFRPNLARPRPFPSAVGCDIFANVAGHKSRTCRQPVRGEIIMKLRKALLCVAAAPILLAGLAAAQSSTGQSADELEQRKFEFQQQLEAQKLQLEKDKLDEQRRQTSITRAAAMGTAGSVLVALIIGLGTIFYQFVLKRRDFEMKAAEIIMQGDNPWVTRAKADGLLKIFRKRLTADFATEFDPAYYGAGFQILQTPNLPDIGAPREGVMPDLPAANIADQASTAPLISAFNTEIQSTRQLYLAYVYQISKIPGQKYDVTVFLMRHVAGHDLNQRKFRDVERAEFYFGPSWTGVFVASPVDVTDGVVGVRISAWGSFWATCRVKLSNVTDPVIIHRHIDFEMPPYYQTRRG
jgi:hypothetical protein